MIPPTLLEVAAIREAFETGQRPAFDPGQCADALPPEYPRIDRYEPDYASDTDSRPFDPTPWAQVARRLSDWHEFRRDNLWAIRVKGSAS